MQDARQLLREGRAAEAAQAAGLLSEMQHKLLRIEETLQGVNPASLAGRKWMPPYNRDTAASSAAALKLVNCRAGMPSSSCVGSSKA